MEKIAMIYTDGATIGHNGKLGTVKEVGLGIYIKGSTCIARKRQGGSNNEAEFMALIVGMKECLSQGIKCAVFHLDSKIVVNRANGNRPRKKKYQNERMDSFQEEVKALAEQFSDISFEWIPREENKTADWLSKQACRL